MSLHLRTLGDLSLEGVSFTRPKSLLLLTFLTLEGPQDRRHLAELFYPGGQRPLGGLSSGLARLRSGAAGAVGTDKARAWSLVKCDAQELLTAFDAGEYARCVDLYRDRFLAGVYLKNWSSELEEWVYGTREYLADRVRDSHLFLAEAEAARGDFEAAGRRAEEAYSLPGAGEPELEELERIHRLLVAGGHPWAGEVRKEAASFGITLEVAMETAREQLRGSAVEVGRGTRHNLPTDGTSFVGRDAELVDLAELLDQDENRLLTLAGPGGIGKTRLALQLARDQLRQDRFPDGVIFVPLTALTTPASIVTGIAAGLGVELRSQEDPLPQVRSSIGDKRLLMLLDGFEHLVEGATIAADLVQTCPNLKLLVTSRERLNLAEELVFPVEGLLSASSESTPVLDAQYRDSITLFEHRAKSADLRFTATPEVMPEVLRICRLVEGSPLGIELAAVWVRLMPPAEIAGEIERNLDFLATPTRNIAERHRSVRAVFDHSWELLSSSEQGVLRRLSVFRGGFRREAANEVARATIPVLASLVDKSLMRVSPSGRYYRHALLYQFTREKLAEFEQEHESTLERHVLYYLALAEEAEPQLTGDQQIAWLDRLEEETENIQAVISWSLEHDRANLGLRLANSLRHFWLVRGSLRRGRGWLTQLLEHPGTQERSRVRARALRHAGILARGQGEFLAAIPLVRESVAILRELGDTLEIPKSLGLLGSLIFYGGDDDAAGALFEQCLAITRESGDRQGTAIALNHLGTLATRRRDYDAARALFDESLTIMRELEDRRGTAFPLNHLGILATRGRDYDAAHALFEEGLAIMRELEDRHGIALLLIGFGELADSQGDYGAAHALLEQGLALYRELEDTHGIAKCLESSALAIANAGDTKRAVRLWGAGEALRAAIHAPMSDDERVRFDPKIAAVRNSLGEDEFLASWNEGSSMPLEQAIDLVFSADPAADEQRIEPPE